MIVLASAEDGNVSIVSAVTKDLTQKVHAGKLAGAVAQAVGGKGGGRPILRKRAAKTPRHCRRRSTRSTPTWMRCCDRARRSDHRGGPDRARLRHRTQETRGLEAVLFDKGCLTNSLYNYPTNMVFFTTPELLEIGDIPMTSLNEKPVRTEALKYYRTRGRPLSTRHSPVRARRRASMARTARSRCTRRTGTGAPGHYGTRKVILATGYYDRPNAARACPARSLPKVIHYYKEPHPYYGHDVHGGRRQELRGHCGAGTALDRCASDAGAPAGRAFGRTSSTGLGRTSTTASRTARSRRTSILERRRIDGRLGGAGDSRGRSQRQERFRLCHDWVSS